MILKDLQDKHLGSMAFVIGAGPSIHFQDLEPLSEYVTITVNSGILAFEECDYFISDDIGAKNWNYYLDNARKSKCTKILYADKLKAHCRHFRQEEIILFKHKWWYDPHRKVYNMSGLEMTKDAEAPIVGARTSMGSAIHFAYIMGCDPIVMLGCDCCYLRGKRYFWQFPGEKKAFRVTGEQVFCDPNRGKIRGKPVDSHCCDFDEYWTKFAEINDGVANIIYASEGGLLDCFPIMTLVDVIEKFIDRKK